MVDLIERRDMILERLSGMITDCDATPQVVEPVDWMEREGQPNHLFGFGLPFLNDDEEPVIPFCPDLMAAHTLPLDDMPLDMYLDIIEFMLAKHVVLLEDEPDDVKRQHIIENELWNIKPEAMSFLTQIQMQALDMAGEDE